MTVYYNEFDPFAAQWLRELIDLGRIAPGVVDERSVEDVRPDDLAGYTQCHFFAGIGVWSYALRLAGWPDNRPVWTASCPCQPFSASGRRTGFDDERHLWPHLHWLIEQRDPAIVFGEQVASKAAEPWIDLVQADLEALDYAFGCVPFPSASVGAPHIRDRAYWVADSGSPGLPKRISDGGIQRKAVGAYAGQAIISSGDPVRLADSGSTGRQEQWGRPEQRQPAREPGFTQDSTIIGLGDSPRQHPGRDAGAGIGSQTGIAMRAVGDCLGTPSAADGAGPTNGLWRDADWLLCRDGKWRPVEPGTFPLVDGAPARVGRLRGYGNAINAEAARAWIEAVMEAGDV